MVANSSRPHKLTASALQGKLPLGPGTQLKWREADGKMHVQVPQTTGDPMGQPAETLAFKLTGVKWRLSFPRWRIVIFTHCARIEQLFLKRSIFVPVII
jgi:hypothetical protein